jgi:hypothetical protein
MGFYHFDQIAAWTPAEVAWVDARLKFKGRIERDDWIAQAAALAGRRLTRSTSEVSELIAMPPGATPGASGTHFRRHPRQCSARGYKPRQIALNGRDKRKTPRYNLGRPLLCGRSNHEFAIRSHQPSDRLGVSHRPLAGSRWQR